MHIHTHVYIHAVATPSRGGEPSLTLVGRGQMGSNTNGAAAEVINFDRFGKKVRPGAFWKIKVGQRQYPTSPCVNKNITISRDPISANPICPFPTLTLAEKRHTESTGQPMNQPQA